MKRYTMIFVSVILALMTSLIMIDEVKADTFVHNNIIYDVDEILEDIRDYNSNYTIDNYPYISIHPLENGFNFYMINNIDNNCYDSSGNVYSDIVCANSDEYFLKVFDHGGAYGSLGGFNGLIKYVYNDNDATYSIDYSSGSTNRFYFPGTKTNKNNYYNEHGTLDGFYDELILYSNFSFMDDITDNSTYVSYKNFLKINITSGFACDLNGKDMEHVTIDFSNYANEKYTYQYGIKRRANIDTIVWHDISELNNYTYNFNEYYNETIIYARVLDSDGNEITQNQYTINNDELPKFGLNITSGLACPIPNYDGDPQAEIINIDFSNAYFENYKYYYYYDSRATKYEINVTSEQLTHQITEYLYNFIYFVIYDENDNLIYYAYNSVSDRLGFTPDDYEMRHNIEISDGVACDLEGNKIINIQFDFSNITKYVNHYNFDVVINGEHFGSILYHEITLNEQNYVQDYNVEIYVDGFLYKSDSHRVGGLLGEEEFEATYDNMLNNGDWNEDLNVEDVEDMSDLVIQFLGAISSFIATFFDLLDFFFQRLNFWIRACIITLFIELVICKIIKGVRK